MVLAHDLSQRLGPQPISERTRGFGRKAGRLEEIAHGSNLVVILGLVPRTQHLNAAKPLDPKDKPWDDGMAITD
jgi:hypothetical protein